MAETRIVLIDLPGVLGGSVRACLVPAEREPALTVVAEYGAGVAADEAVSRTGADVVIMGARPGWEDDVLRCLERHPRVRALGVVDDGRRGSVIELAPRAREIVELSRTALLRAVATPISWRLERG